MFEQDTQFIRDLIGNLDTCYFTMCRSVPESTTFPKPFSLWHGDPFKMNWGGYYLNTFPPFSLLSRCPLKILGQDKAQGLLIAQLWPTDSHLLPNFPKKSQWPTFFRDFTL